MGYVPIEELLKNSDESMYKLVTLASRRAKELGAGSGKLVDAAQNAKITSVTFEEIRQGKIILKSKKK